MNIWLVGGDKVIPTSVEKAIQGDGYTVKRISGEDRYETAAQVAEAGISLSGKKPSKVFVASGTSFADALAVSPVAFAKGYPIILTEKDSTSEFSKKQLGNIGTDAKILVGGESVVSKKVQADLSIKDEQRVAGADRAVTANLVSDWAKASEGFNPANAILVGGTNGNGADSLVAASLGGKSFSTLHFAGWDATSVYFKDHAKELTGKGFVFGGKAAVSQGDVDKAQAAAQTVISNQAFGITADAVTAATETSRTYTVSGLTAGKAVRIALVDAEQVKGGAFALTASGSDGNRLATLAFTPTATNVWIDQINGVAVTGGMAQSFTPSGTSLTFRVTSRTATDAVAVPVLFADTDSTNHTLKVNLDGVPTSQSFAIGGAVTFKKPEAAALPEASSGTISSGPVEHLYDKGFDLTASNPTTQYVMRDADVYKFNGTVITKAQFLSILSLGDTLSGTYVKSSTAAAPSTFDLTADTTLTSVQPAASSKGSTATVTYMPDASWSVGGTKVVLSRAQVVSGVQGAWKEVKSETLASLKEQSFSETLPDGTYIYKLVASAPAFSGTASATSVTAVDSTSAGTISASTAAMAASTTTVSTTTSTTAPTVRRLYLSSNSTDVNHLNKGDVFKVVLSSGVAAPVEGAKLTVGGQVFTYAAASTTNAAGDATFSLNSGTEVVDGVSHASGRVLTVTLLANPVGGVLPFDSSLVLSSSVGIANSAGNLGTSITVTNLLTQDVIS